MNRPRPPGQLLQLLLLDLLLLELPLQHLLSGRPEVVLQLPVLGRAAPVRAAEGLGQDGVVVHVGEVGEEEVAVSLFAAVQVLHALLVAVAVALADATPVVRAAAVVAADAHLGRCMREKRKDAFFFSTLAHPNKK